LGVDFEHAGAGFLAANADRAPAQRQEHRVRRHRRVPHEGSFLAGVEETQPHIMVGAIGSEYERDLGVGELTGYAE
jgi:hypothetical protein